MRRAKRLATTQTVIDKKKAPEGLGAHLLIHVHHGRDNKRDRLAKGLQPLGS